MKRLLCCMMLLVGLLSGAAPGQEGDTSFRATAEASVSSFTPGQSFYIAMRGAIPEGLHAYYRNPGSVGEAVSAQLRLPEGFSAEGPFWEVPHRMSSSGGSILAYGYEKEVVAVWRVQAPQNSPESGADFAIDATVQLCADEGCLPTQEVSASLRLSRGDGAASPTWNQIEQRVETLGDVSLSQLSASRGAGGAIDLRFTAPVDQQKAYFFSDDNSVAPDAPQTVRREGDVWLLSLPRNDGKNLLYPAPEKRSKTLSGNLVFADGSHARIADVPIEWNGGSRWAVPAGLWGVAVGLFLGGFLLNLMPCVFPVLGLKVMGFVELSGGSRGKVVAHSLAFTSGILVSFWALGLILVGVSQTQALLSSPWQDWAGILLWGDEGGADRSWASWMENQWVVYGIVVLLMVLGLWMYGVFEFGARATGIGGGLQRRGGMIGSFLQGLLVTVVAAPCSGPFLGAAMAPALAMPGLWLLVALSAMAVGLALPYLVLGIFPGLVAILPRPGAWMESLRQAFAFFMLAAAAWMLDVYLSFADGGAGVMIGLVVVAAGCWVFGRWCPLWRSRLSRWLGGFVALCLVGAGVFWSMPRDREGNAAVDWVDWSPAAVAEALEDGSPVFVDFTAKWCATCQANKLVAYSDEVRQLLEERGVVLMRADKTKPNEKIDAELRRLNRSAVPTNALYLPGKEPIVTRELLTPDYLLDFLRENLPHEEEQDEDSTDDSDTEDDDTDGGE